MKKLLILSVLGFVACFLACGTLSAQKLRYKSKYPDIPIVDVHAHAVKMSDLTDFTKVSDAIEKKYGSNLSFWISLETPPEPMAELKAANDRVLYSVTQMRPLQGLTVTADEVIEKVKEGYVGLMFWFGNPYNIEGRLADRIDDEMFADFFASLEKAGVVMTSGQISDPNGPFGNRGRWMPDPVAYWTQIRAFENVLSKYPGLTVIAAYGAWSLCQDGQIDYLRYLLAHYPNLYVDIGATCQYLYQVGHENLRDFFMEFQDRILFGTDGGRFTEGQIDTYAERYAKYFALLETDQIVNGGYWGDKPTRGLYLPREVLEKIYYKNALKLYPGLKKAMGME
jgi:predicted TIM-barrel fold metal-dependent hydrolase